MFTGFSLVKVYLKTWDLSFLFFFFTLAFTLNHKIKVKNHVGLLNVQVTTVRCIPVWKFKSSFEATGQLDRIESPLLNPAMPSRHIKTQRYRLQLLKVCNLICIDLCSHATLYPYQLGCFHTISRGVWLLRPQSIRFIWYNLDTILRFLLSQSRIVFCIPEFLTTAVTRLVGYTPVTGFSALYGKIT